MTKPSTYGTVARLCQIYLDQYSVYLASRQPPKMPATLIQAEKGLDSLIEKLNGVIAPETFMKSLEG